jgi:hypothetical protein
VDAAPGAVVSAGVVAVDVSIPPPSVSAVLLRTNAFVRLKVSVAALPGLLRIPPPGSAAAVLPSFRVRSLTVSVPSSWSMSRSGPSLRPTPPSTVVTAWPSPSIVSVPSIAGSASMSRSPVALSSALPAGTIVRTGLIPALNLIVSLIPPAAA